MVSPYQYPWVKFGSTPTASIDSSALPIYGAPVTTIVDSIRLCNTSQNDIFVTIFLLAERDLVTTTTYFETKFFLAQNSSARITIDSDILQDGDILYANSDYSGNKFDTHVSWRQLLETA